MSRKGGVLSGGFQPLKAPNAPTVDSVSAGVLSASVTVSAPANTGDGTVSGYVVTAKQSDGSLATGTSSSAGAVSVTLTAGGTTEFAAQAFSEYGPGQFSGFGNSTAVPSGQELYTWGQSGQGQTGQNSTSDLSSPVQVGALTTWSQISAVDSNHVAAIKTDGTLWTWGNNGSGQLGHNDRLSLSSPVQVGALTTWAQVSAGRVHTAAIKIDGTLWVWGDNGEGRLGTNSPITTDRSSPVQVGALTTWTHVDAGVNHTAATKTDGTLWIWGFNADGRLGVNDTTARSSPVQVGALTTWYQASAGHQHTSATKTNGTLWTWGSNDKGQTGQNNTVNSSSPVQVGALTTWSQISSGDGQNAAIKTDGTLWTWGEGGAGQLGHNNTIYRSSPVQVGALATWSQTTTGANHTVAVKTDGTLWAWGEGIYGQLGQNNTVYYSSPVQVGALATWSHAEAGGGFTAAIEQSFT